MMTQWMIDSQRAVSNARPEMRLLLACARTQLEPETKRKIRQLLEQPIEWKLLLDLAGVHKARPLLHRSLYAVDSSALPEDFQKRLSKMLSVITMNCFRLASELAQLLSLAEPEGISVVPFKGPTLAASVYGGVALREYSDLDLLVREQDIPQVARFYEPLGYEMVHGLEGAKQEAEESSGYHYKLVRPGLNALIELHWEMTWGYMGVPLRAESLFGRLQPVSVGIGEHKVMGLPPEELMLALCIHGTKHLWQRLQWLCDVAELVRVSPEMDWNRVIALGREFRCAEMIALGLLLAQGLLGKLPVPEETMRQLCGHSGVFSVAATLRERILRGDALQGESDAEVWLQMKLSPRFSTRAQILFHGIRPRESDRAAIALPRPLHFLYYLVRGGRLACKYGSRKLAR